jgi:signal transduction histidine kinase
MKKQSKSMDYVKILGKIIDISHSNLEIAARLNAILNIISSALHYDEALIYTLDKDKRLTCRYTNREGHLLDFLGDYRCHVGEGVVGTVAQKRAPLFYTINNIPPRFGCLFYSKLDVYADRYRVFAFYPLADDSFLYGVLLLCSSLKEAITDQEKFILSLASRELGGILRTNDLHLSSKKRISELATLSELGKVLTSTSEPRIILDSIALITSKALNAGFGTIRLQYAFLKLDVQRFTSGSIDPTIQEQVYALENQALSSRKPTALLDLAPSGNSIHYSIFAVPIISRDRVLGTISLGRERDPRSLSAEDDDQYLISTIANYISSGLENALLNIKLRDVLKELGDAQRRLIEHEKLRSLGEMTANIAHEIKNPLVIIGGFTKRLAKKVQLDEREHRYVDIILKEVVRLESILTEILSYVKETPLLLETCDINALLDELLYLLASDKTWENIRIVKEYNESSPTIICDVQQIKQVLINILINAFDAMNSKGTITVKTEGVTHRDRSFVAVSLMDTGGGIDPALLDNIFNPFFTTKDRGSGLGLAISNKIVMHHNGHIEVKNKAGEGVTFIVYLPANSTLLKEG